MINPDSRSLEWITLIVRSPDRFLKPKHQLTDISRKEILRPY